MSRSQPQAEATAPNGPALPTEQHVPLSGFNAAEIEKFLAQGVDAKAQVYKPQAGEGTKSGNPWGAKRMLSDNLLTPSDLLTGRSW